jgi:hypothetical protein
MDIVRNADGTLIVAITPARARATDESADAQTGDEEGATVPTSRVLHPGEGGYDEALADWDRQQNPDRAEPVSTASGREEAMSVVHAVATSDEHDVAAAVNSLDDPAAGAEALRHVLVGGVPSVEAFAAEVAEAEGGDPLPAHKATTIIGEVLAELD